MKAALLTAAALLAAAPVLAETMDLSKIEPKMMDAATAAVPGFTASSAAMDGDVLEIAGTAGGKTYEVDLNADGSIEEVEEEIAADALPAEVKAMADMMLPGFAASKVEKSTRGDVTWYEMDGAHAGKEVDVEIRADGQVMLFQMDAAG